jgi:hypothetical protein
VAEKVTGGLREGGRAIKELGDRARDRGSDKASGLGGNTVARNPNGDYVYTDKYGNTITTGYGPNDMARSGTGMMDFNPVLQAAANNRGVNLYAQFKGGKLQGTPQVDAGYLKRNPMGMDYTVGHMNPWEFADAYNREGAGQKIDWGRESYAGKYSPVAQPFQQLQDMYRSQGLQFNGYQMPQQQNNYDDWLQQLLPVLTGGGQGYGNYNGGINAGGMYGPLYGGGQMYAGGSPYFNEFTGSYNYPPMGGYYGGFNPYSVFGF